MSITQAIIIKIQNAQFIINFKIMESELRLIDHLMQLLTSTMAATTFKPKDEQR